MQGGDFIIIPTASDVVYQSIKSMLMSGELKPDEKINVDELSRILNISKTPVREVLKKFEQKGLLNYYPRVGWKVVKLSKEEYFDIVEIQELLETYICSNIAEYIPKIDFDELTEANNEIARAIANKQYESILELNEKFHLIIYDVYPNIKLLDHLQSVWNSIKIQRNTMVKTDGFVQNIVKEHEEIINSLKDKDINRLLKANRKHFTSGRIVINNYYDELE